MEILKDLFGFLNTVSFIDLIFFFSVVVLIILVVSLIYFIKINDEVFQTPIKEEFSDAPINIEQTSMAYDANEENELLDLKAISKAIEENKESNIDLTAYEQEQEQRAIISYDELLAKNSNSAINYSLEENIDDITIKKVDLENLLNPEKNEEPKLNVQVISYAKEEAFLEALKKLQEKLN